MFIICFIEYRMAKRSVTLYLVRHGEAKSNVLGLLTSYPEKTPRSLTERGVEQIAQTAERLKGEGIAALIASPLTRTQESAEIISGVLGLPILTDIRLRETDFGAYNNLSIDDFFHKYPNDAAREATDGTDGVEGFSDLRTRLQSFLHDVLDHYAGQSVVLVGHSDSLVALEEVIQKTRTPFWMPSLGSFKKIVYTESI